MTQRNMKAVSLYSGGCDGLSLAAVWAGIETIAFCECDKDCRSQLKRRHPDKPIFKYDTEVLDGLRTEGINTNTIDIILASPPCQCASVAGERLGDADERNRWPQFLDVVRGIRPRWIMAENVPGLLSVNAGRLFGTILRELAEMGYDAGWGVFGASDVGAPHRRERLCIVAYRDAERKPQQEGADSDVRGWVGNSSRMADTQCAGLPFGDGGVDWADGRGGRLERCSSVGDAQRGSMRNDSQNERAPDRKIHTLTDAGASFAEMGDAQSIRLEGQRSGGDGITEARRRKKKPQSTGDEQHGRPTQPGVGSLLDGVLARLAAQRWPAGRGEGQYEWEPPRTVNGMKGRAALIKMYGNAVVPEWAIIPLALIAGIEHGRIEKG